MEMMDKIIENEMMIIEIKMIALLEMEMMKRLKVRKKGIVEIGNDGDDDDEDDDGVEVDEDGGDGYDENGDN
jgi:hypothetical protein